MPRFIIVFCALWLAMGCRDTKKTPGKQDTTRIAQSNVTPDKDTAASEKASDLSDLVYESIGNSILKMESNARSQAELKGRKDMIRVLAEEAKKLIADFSKIQPGLFAENLNAEAYGKAVEESMNKSTTLKGCQVSEYKTSGDTTYAFMEIPLMNGYEIIEKALTETGIKNNYLKSDKAEVFKKLFNEYFIAEKKKLLTPPV